MWRSSAAKLEEPGSWTKALEVAMICFGFWIVSSRHLGEDLSGTFRDTWKQPRSKKAVESRDVTGMVQFDNLV